MTRRTPLQLIPLLALAGVASFTAAPLAGQSLHLAELFVEQGRLDDARAEVGAWFEIRGDAATPEEVQHGLWLQGRLLEDRVAARRDLERLVSSYPDGPYTALALTWLADSAAQEGEESVAMAYQARVVRDFPESEAAATARDWLDARGVSVEPPATEPPAPTDQLAQATPAMMPPRGATLDPPVDSTVSAANEETPPARMPARADSAATTTVSDSVTEILDPVAVDSAAVATVEAVLDPPVDTAPPVVPPADTVPAVTSPVDTAPTSADTAPVTADPEPVANEPVENDPVEASTVEAPPVETPVPVAASGDPVPGAAEGGAFAVQIGAFRNPDGAAGLVDELIAAGFDARLVGVPDSSLFRVRIGRYGDLDQAGTELARVREAGHDGAVVNDARRELVVSR